MAVSHPIICRVEDNSASRTTEADVLKLVRQLLPDRPLLVQALHEPRQVVDQVAYRTAVHDDMLRAHDLVCAVLLLDMQAQRRHVWASPDAARADDLTSESVVPQAPKKRGLVDAFCFLVLSMQVAFGSRDVGNFDPAPALWHRTFAHVFSVAGNDLCFGAPRVFGCVDGEQV